MEQKAIFLNNSEVTDAVNKHGSPIYVYSQSLLKQYGKEALKFKGPYGTTVRYAVKANPHPQVISIFDRLGLFFDASSGGEVEMLIDIGINPSKIALNSQQLPENLQELTNLGVYFTATSLHQLETFGSLSPGATLGVRLNPGIGSGENKKVLTGGVTAGFGIWHEYIPDIIKIAKKYNLTINKVHTHIGAGTDPAVWARVAEVTVKLSRSFKDVAAISLGGGFKVGRMDTEPTVDVPAVGKKVHQLLMNNYKKTGQKLHVEIEPGTYLTALTGLLIAQVIDVVDTGKDGYSFIRTNTGMNDFLRPIMYGAQHPMWIVPKNGQQSPDLVEYVVIGHNCESGDLLTPQRDNPDTLGPRLLPKAQIGDYVVIGGAGAYCAAMSAKGYNSFKSAKEVVI
jgi:diaminopimelate decarboxylase